MSECLCARVFALVCVCMCVCVCVCACVCACVHIREQYLLGNVMHRSWQVDNRTHIKNDSGDVSF
jgi:hypothetical protein